MAGRCPLRPSAQDATSSWSSKLASSSNCTRRRPLAAAGRCTPGSLTAAPNDGASQLRAAKGSGVTNPAIVSCVQAVMPPSLHRPVLCSTPARKGISSQHPINRKTIYVPDCPPAGFAALRMQMPCGSAVRQLRHDTSSGFLIRGNPKAVHIARCGWATCMCPGLA
jgi:hypothetical protein